ncbi:metallophosphoesterase family protein [Candidatus Sumerlaeota bacterium]|nr:metallophosphoesterase family protein [Candidatus Sumerlaeota bacterium]
MKLTRREFLIAGTLMTATVPLWLPSQETAPVNAPGGRPPEQGTEGPTFHHRVTWMGDPSTEAVLSWTTRAAGKEHRVYYDTESRAGKLEAYAQKQATFKDGQYKYVQADEAYAKPGFYHHAHLTGLKPNTTYHVVYASDGDASREFHFRTAPAEDVDFTALAGGDSRLGKETPTVHVDRRKMNERMRALFESKDENVLCLVHGGDYCMTAQWRHIERWMTDHELTTTADGRLLPVVPTRGNHDSAIGFEEMFSHPTLDKPFYFKTQLSPKVGIVTLNTEISVAGDQRDWLAATLPAMRNANRWLFAIYHRPLFSSVRDVQDGAGRRNNWAPLFEANNIDIAYESHDHALKRTVPIRASAVDEKSGIVYFGDGGLGVPQRKPDTTRWWLQPPGIAQAAHHVHTLKFTKESLRVQAIGMNGEVLDDYTAKPRDLAALAAEATKKH